MILHHLHNSRADCSMEAAGALTQLTNPNHAFVKLNERFESTLLRLLSLVDICKSSESILLCSAAISNLSLQDTKQATQLLYQHNAILRKRAGIILVQGIGHNETAFVGLVKVSRRIPCLSLSVQEQIVN